MIEIKKVLKFYPHEERQILNTPCEPFEETDFETVDELFQTMWKTVMFYDGIGLAGPQIGINKNIFIVVTGQNVVEIFINPEILATQGSEKMQEGCLSLPEIFVPIEAPQKVKVRYQNLAGAWIEAEFEGIVARAIMHEMAHLEGKLITDRCSHLNKQIALEKARKNHKNPLWTLDKVVLEAKNKELQKVLEDTKS